MMSWSLYRHGSVHPISLFASIHAVRRFDFNGSRGQIGVTWKDSIDIVKRKMDENMDVSLTSSW